MMTAAEKQKSYRARHLEKCMARVTAYQASERGKAVLAAYKTSKARASAIAKYNASDKARASKAKYRHTQKNREAQRRYDATPQGRLRRALRDRVIKAIKRGKGTRAGSAVRDLGCSIDFFKTHIEGRFVTGMSWENHGRWHLDHIKPLALFDLTDRAQFVEAMHFTNYQPLWAADNWRKAAIYG